jgi:Laminin G domain
MHLSRTTRALAALSATCAVAVALPASALAGTAALWHMDETSGTVMHDAAGNHNGTLHHVQTGVSGYQRTAFGFSRSANSEVTVPSASSLNPGSGSFTISLHVWATVAPSKGDDDLVKKGSYGTAGGEYKVELLQNGRASCAFKGSKHYAAVSGGPDLTTGHWFTVRCTKTSTSVILKVAGRVFTKDVSVGTIANTSQVGLGAAPGSDFTTGRLDEVALIHGT